MKSLLSTVLLAAGGQWLIGGIKSEPLNIEMPEKEPSALFTEFSLEASGMAGFENRYSGPYVFKKRWREYLIGTIGTGLALGDVDGDRYPDLFIVSKDEKSRLYRNLDGRGFEDVTDASGIADKGDPASGAAFADVDNDGDLDLYLCFVAAENELWINAGDGTFEERGWEWGADINTGSSMASFADYDRDGDLDFYLLTNLIHWEDETEKLPDRLFENRGQRFEEATSRAGISGRGHGHASVWWDFNGDFWPDIYVSNDFEELDKLYRNNGDGTFTDVYSDVAPEAPFYSMGVDFGDINNDGQSDFWASDMAASNREKHMRTMGNNWHVYSHQVGGKSVQAIKNTLLLNLFGDRFTDIAFLSGLAKTDWTWAARLADLDNDGWLDAFATNGMLRSFHDTDVITRGGHTTAEALMSTAFINEPVLDERNFAFRNNQDLGFQETGDAWGLSRNGVSFGAAFGDLDKDGDLDIVVNNFNDAPSVYRNNEYKNSRITIELKGIQSNRFGIGAKVTVISGGQRQTKELASMRGYMSTDQPVLHFGLGQSLEIGRLEAHWPSGVKQVFRNLPANRHYIIEEAADQVAGAAADKEAAFFREVDAGFPEELARQEAYFSDFSRQPLLPFKQSSRGGSIQIGDLDGDGRNDVVITGASGQEAMVCLNKSGFQFENALILDLEEDFGSEDRGVLLEDWDMDGDLDLAIASGGVELDEGDAFYQDRLYMNPGDGNLARDWGAAISEGLAPSSALAAGDWDSDGDLDLFVAGGTLPGRYPFAAKSTLWRNDGGSWTEISDLLAPGLSQLEGVTDAVWVDVNSDGDADLFLVLEWGEPELWIQKDGVLKTNPSLLPSGLAGLWNCIEAGDLNGDGLVDVVVGNWGLNSDYKASVEYPIRLWHSSGREGRVKLIETYVDGGEEWVREEKWRMEKSFPREMRRIATHKQYAGLNFAEAMPGVTQSAFAYKEATELRTGILWQKADGYFEFASLPSFAQLGRAMDILIADFNEDGRIDILLSLERMPLEVWGNSAESGHLGLFLNEGGRRFRPVMPGEAGLNIDGAPRGLALGDLDGDHVPELAVYLSRGLPKLFRKAVQP